VATSRYRRKRQCPYVISAHGMLDPWALRHSRWKKVSAWFLYEQAHLRAASCVRALSEAEARALRKLGLKNPIAIVPNGIDLPKSNAQGESMVDSRNAVRDGPLCAVKTEGRKILLYLGRIHPKKGLVNLLQAWASVQRQPPSGSDHRPFQWLLVLAGWDQIGHEAELKRLCDELDLRWSAASNPNLNRNRNRKLSLNPSTFGDSCSLKAALRPQASASVLFLGPQFKETKRACYVDCDAFILPSFSEGQPMVVLEAWAQGKPVLMTPQCNLPEGFQSRAAIQIEPTRAGVELGLRALFEMSDAERTQMGERGRELVAARFNWARVAEEMNQLYRWILGGGPKPACITD
jgi:poly(glycerol-phosphate) alpha-glucosyltransferase